MKYVVSNPMRSRNKSISPALYALHLTLRGYDTENDPILLRSLPAKERKYYDGTDFGYGSERGRENERTLFFYVEDKNTATKLAKTLRTILKENNIKGRISIRAPKVHKNPSAKKSQTYVTRLPKGEYYVVDPCYVLGDLYDKFLPDLLKIKNAKAFEYENGKLRRVGNDLQDRTFVVTTDFGGDGTYDGQIRSGGKTRKFGVGVDAGMVSLIPVKMVKEIGQKSMMGPFPKIKFVDMADVVIYKDARGMTTSFEASDGRSTVRVDF
jgi:hypothetical protein